MRIAKFLPLFILISIASYGQVKNIIFIDASNTEGLYAIYDRVTMLIGELAQEGEYVLFISNDTEPIIIDQTGDLKEALDQLFIIRPGNPLPKDDSMSMLKYLEKKQLDSDVKLHVFSSLYVLATLRQLSTYYQDFLVMLGYDISLEEYFNSLSLYFSSADVAQNEVDFKLIDNLYPYPIINY